MDLVLDEEVHERHDGAKEGTGDVFAVLDGGGVGRAERDAAKHPRDGGDEVGDHEDVVPVVVVGRRDIGPAAARDGAEDTKVADGLGEGVARLGRQQVPETDESEARTWEIVSRAARSVQRQR